MTTSTLSPIAGLRRAVCADPHDDTARLVLADALDESGDPMQAKWAALIRCGCELAAIPDPPPEPSVGMRSASRSQRLAALHVWSMQWKAKYYALLARESALLRELTPWLRRGERCERCKGKGRFTNSTKLGGTHTSGCPTCHGTGWLGSLAEQKARSMNARQLADAALNGGDNGYDWLIPATFSRGFVSRVELTAAQVQDAAFLARLFSEWPVTEAGLVGEPYREPHWDGVATSATVVSLGRMAAGLPQIGEGKG